MYVLVWKNAEEIIITNSGEWNWRPKGYRPWGGMDTLS